MKPLIAYCLKNDKAGNEKTKPEGKLSDLLKLNWFGNFERTSKRTRSPYLTCNRVKP